MPTTLPALRGQFGRFEYWLTTMHVEELVAKVRMPKDLPGWDSQSLEERYQREIDIRRVTREIAPYFANNPDRFTGSLVLAVLHDEGMEFEPLNDFGGVRDARVPKAYQIAAANLGFLTLQGNEQLVPLDGQHRAKAFEIAMLGTDERGRSIPGIKSDTALGRDAVAVILVRFESNSARRIFSMINRHAKPTSRVENLITDDDDAVAVATRNLVSRLELLELLPGDLVRSQSSMLNQRAREFTTLSTIYDANKAIIESRWRGRRRPERANEEERQAFEEEIEQVWLLLLEEIELFAEAIQDPSEAGDAVRIAIRAESLLGHPSGQLSLVRGFVLMRDRCVGVSDQELCRRLNRIDWRRRSEQWQGVLLSPAGRVMSGRSASNGASLFIAHLGGVDLAADERAWLLGWITTDEDYELPAPVV